MPRFESVLKSDRFPPSYLDVGGKLIPFNLLHKYCRTLKGMDLPNFTPLEDAVSVGFGLLVDLTDKQNVMIVSETNAFSNSILSGIVEWTRLEERQFKIPERAMVIVDLKKLNFNSISPDEMCNDFKIIAKALADHSQQFLVPKDDRWNKAIIVLDDIDLLMEPDYSGVFDVLKDYLERESFQCIGATSPGNYSKLKKFDGLFNTHFRGLIESELSPTLVQKSWRWLKNPFLG